MHNTTTSSQQSTEMGICIKEIFGVRIFPTDVTQTYLQSAERPSNERCLYQARNRVMSQTKPAFQLLKSLYSIADTDDCWDRTLQFHSVEN